MTRPFAFLKFPGDLMHTFASRANRHSNPSLQKSAGATISLILLFISFSVKSQNLSLNELFNICKKDNWVEVNEFLLTKGWEYYESSKGDDEHYNTITWSFNKQSYNDRAYGWFYLYTYEGLPNKISVTLFNKQSYNNLKTAINANGMKLIDSHIDDDKIEAKYSNANFIVTMVTEKRQRENETYEDPSSQTIYLIDVVNKSGVYDKDNGLKKSFDTDGNLETEYTLKDGNLHGTAKSYYPNGQLKVISSFVNGKKQGGSKEFDEDGIVTAEYTFQNGEATGPYKEYENGKVKLSGSFINGKKNGQFKVYDSDGLLDIEYGAKSDLRDGKYTEYYYDEGELQFKVVGQYLAGEKVGLWQTIKTTTKGLEILEFDNYSNGVKNGSFKNVRKDSVIFGSYKNGDLHGLYSIYKNMSAWLMGGLHGDTINSPLITKGYYSNGLKNGEWKFYSMSKVLLRVGEYQNDEQTGQWKYYYDNYVDETGNKLPYSKELYLKETYSNGLLNGTSTRHSYIEKVKVKCDPNLNKNLSPTDSCTSSIYRKLVEIANHKNDVLSGSYEFRDSLNNVILKGNYSNGKRDGQWLERFSGDNSSKELLFVYQVGTYKNGNKSGEWKKYFDINDKPFASYTFSDGLLDGKATMPDEDRYFEKGKLKRVVRYDSLGNIEGSYALDYSGGGLICRRSVSIDDHTIMETFSLKSETDDASVYYSNSNLDRPFLFVFTLRSEAKGPIIITDKSGKASVEGNLDGKNRVGTWKWYYYDQDVLMEREYESNEVIKEIFKTISSKSPFSGTLIEKYSNGKTKSQIKISEGLKNGSSKYFTENGELEKSEKYHKGVKQN